MKRILLALAVVLTFSAFKNDHVITVFMIGDSTMANKDISDDKQERGWGMVLQSYFSEEIRVDNHAVNGRSTKSFIDEGRWDKVLSLIKPGDYVIIQFGHNDEKPAADRHTDPGSTFDANLEKFVNETRAKGGIPILCNCVVRRNFYRVVDSSVDDESLRNKVYEDEKVNSDTLIDTHGEYRFAPMNVARKLQVPFVNANRITQELENSLGVKGSRKLHMWFKPGEHPSLPKGKLDNTHYNIYGAHKVASLLIDEITQQVPALTPFVRHYDYVVANDGSGMFFDPQQAVNAAPKNQNITILIGSGEWKKPIVPKDKHITFYFRSDAKWK